jgi:multidrug efflux system membrane fusion protein
MNRYILIACLGVSVVSCREKGDADDLRRTPTPNDAVADNHAASEPGVTVNKVAQAKAGLGTTVIAARPVRPEFTAYGALEEDPDASFTVRATVSGTLHAALGYPWPTLGQRLSAGIVFGQLEPRLLPTDHLNFSTQLATARADLNSSVASVAAAQSAYDRARVLNADNRNVSDKAVEQAAAALASEQAKERAARVNVASLEASLQPGGTIGNQPLNAALGGEVVEIFAHPGEAIEQGAPVLRVARFDHLLVRLDLPVGEQADSPTARIVPTGFENRPALRALRVAVAPATDPHTQGISLLYRLEKTPFDLRPGTAVAAFLPVAGASRRGVLIPDSAIVQHDGRMWAYVQTGAGRFLRRLVPTDVPVPGGYLVSPGFSPGDRVVTTGAQSLLSEEFKSSNETDQQ